jgi:hypothetical protein
MKPRIWVGIIAGFIGLAFTLLICFFGKVMVDASLSNRTEGFNQIFYIFLGEYGAITVLFIFGSVTFGYFAAKQENIITKSEGAKAGAWTGFIYSFLTILPLIFYINYYLIDYFLYVDGSLLSITERLMKTGGRTLWMSLISSVVGLLFGVMGGLMAALSSSSNTIPNAASD